MREVEGIKDPSEPNGGMRSTRTRGATTTRQEKKTPLSKTPVVVDDRPTLGFEKQFEIVREEFSQSMHLLNSSGKVLLGVLEQTLPEERSGRMIGDYTGTNIRKISKSICQLVETKTNLIRTMFQIARDGK